MLGIYDDSIRKRLLSETKLTFEGGVEFSLIAEQVSKDVDSMRKSNTHPEEIYLVKSRGNFRTGQTYSLV